MSAGDYSYARPGGAVLASHGITAVGRYLAADGRGLTRAEYDDLVAHGVHVWLVYEGTAQGMLNGRAQGVKDAEFAQSKIAELGLPADSPVYVTADFDCYTVGQFAACDAYLVGWETVIPVGRTGIYGGLYYLKHVHDAGLASGFWESASLSFRHGVTPAQMPVQIRQTLANPGVPNLDSDTILATEYGAIGDPLTPPEEENPLADLTTEQMQKLADFLAPTMLKTATQGSALTIGDGQTHDRIKQAVQDAQAPILTAVGALEAKPVPALTLSKADLVDALTEALSNAGITAEVDEPALATALAPLLAEHLTVTLASK